MSTSISNGYWLLFIALTVVTNRSEIYLKHSRTERNSNDDVRLKFKINALNLVATLLGNIFEKENDNQILLYFIVYFESKFVKNLIFFLP